jgi:RNA polymerase sigma factor (sigma-70 family)
MDDRELLREYIASQSEKAFAELVARHLNPVYSTALRRVGEPHLAKDVVQTVFIELARKPRSVRDPAALAGWLYRAARHAASNVLRTEGRRRQRENEAVQLNITEHDSHSAWQQLAPHLEEAIDSLDESDQNLIASRFFEGMSLRELGNALALTEDAAQKRVSRAVEKLRAYFTRRGITIASATIAAVLTAHSVQAAPAGFAAGVASSSLAGASTAAKTGLLAAFKTTLVTTAVIATIAIPVVWQHHEISRLRREQANLKQQAEQAAQLSQQNQQLTEQLQALNQQLTSQNNELLRLRSEATRLQQAQKPSAAPATKDSSAKSIYPTAPRISDAIAAARTNGNNAGGLVKLPPEVSLQIQYGNLFQKLDLTADQISAFMKIQEDKQDRIAAYIREHPFDRQNLSADQIADARDKYQEQLDEQIRSFDREADAQVKQLLGPDDYDYYRAYSEQQKERTVLMGGYREKLESTGTPPLTLDQMEQLVSLAHQHQLAAGYDSQLQSEQTSQMLQQAAAFLTPEQIQILNQYTPILMSLPRKTLVQ